MHLITAYAAFASSKGSLIDRCCLPTYLQSAPCQHWQGADNSNKGWQPAINRFLLQGETYDSEKTKTALAT